MRKKLKNYIKQSRLGGIATKCGDIWSNPLSLILTLRLLNIKKNSVVLVGTPTHYNLGDHLIAENEIIFLKKYCGYSDVIEIPTRIFQHNMGAIQKHLKKNVPVFITGGGWMGDVWEEDEKILEQMVEVFHEHSIVILPQTVYYEKSLKENDRAITNTRKLFCRTPNLVILSRERKSFDTCVRLFSSPNITNYLAPDMGLLMFQKKERAKLPLILFCLRDDRERVECDIISQLFDFSRKHGLQQKKVSTIFTSSVPVWKRKKIITQLEQKMGSAKLVVTDRLHGMIFSVISGTKCLAIDNRTHKVSGVYDSWLKNCSTVFIYRGQTKEQIIEGLEELIRSKNNDNWHDKIEEQFINTASFIRKTLKNDEC